MASSRSMNSMTGSESFGLAIPEIGVNQARHELSHHGGDPKRMSRLTRCDTFLTQRFADFLDKLKVHDEQGESLLDRTMILFGSGMSYGHNHGNANVPLILAGGKSLGLRHGAHLDYNLTMLGAYDLSNGRQQSHLRHGGPQQQASYQSSQRAR